MLAPEAHHEEVIAAAPPRSKAQPAQPAPAVAAATARPRSGPGPAEIPDPTYYAARQLDVYPALAMALDLRYSAGAAAANAQGRVLLLVLIDANGAVDDVGIVESDPSGYFDDDARRAFLAARFKPALRNGRAVKSRVLVYVNYGMGESSAP